MLLLQICGRLLRPTILKKRNLRSAVSKRKPRQSKNRSPANKPQPAPRTRQHRIPSKILESLPEETRTAIVQAEAFVGPLPPPVLYRQYEETLQGSADRILRLTEREQNGRQKWEMKILESYALEMRRGQFLGFFLGALAIIGGVYCAQIDQPWVAAILVGTALTGILTAFINNRKTPPSDN